MKLFKLFLGSKHIKLYKDPLISLIELLMKLELQADIAYPPIKPIDVLGKFEVEELI
jgi:hypothetical protein